jgi:hypothetical protein
LYGNYLFEWEGHCWLTPVILATQEVETRRISVPSQLGEVVGKTTSLKNLTSKVCWRGSSG